MVEVDRGLDTKLQPGPDMDRYSVMVARAKALVPALRERASRTEELRRLPPETERDLLDSGLFRILQPKRVGGSELDYVALVDCADALGQGDASVSWNFANLASHHWMLGMFAPEAQSAVWGEDPDALIASSFVFPAGRARKVGGGYVLSGHWPFSSGVESCGWNMLASVVASDDEADGVEYRLFLLNRRDYSIDDTWNAAGLRGTGSNDVRVTDAFVPEHMTVAVSDLAGGATPGSIVNPNALYMLPVFSLFPYVLSGVGLGNAQACLDDYVEIARHRVSTYNRAKIGDLQSTQIKIAEASAKIDAARLIMRTNCVEALAEVRRGDIPGIAAKTKLRRDGAFAVNLCTEAVSLLFAAGGARSLFTSGALQRQFRDAHAVNSHLAFNFDAAGTNYGRVALGLPSENLTL
ncbi:3-hydroxy-9,10-secoandrosta-1,3,5(10)-triene-9,17-dione monooxygenase [Bradyrhizobium elkanii]|jgi:3-hydroxy-9,10-secoandrosta-1,3,5(10)-triene-9,17-dione monooxygenase|uniref:3-hydroxy-9,10-secoandrosta-1,3,5(10)-triene-9, 17-dione monooxygenase n=2 Tax=Nitrobacteraceae TaxID=41294 RepID=A0A8I2C5C0_BRAEL|nr:MULTISPECIES: acyl-CoA dehydrogenase family protein [Bradyrhizobium]MBP1295644.1 3-hydroxy-9,10-secoandrosta-1,3,5(10)-triene-9,17-dione monooxygenase [Bradyrhizobium elkanii]MCP1933457.1 3-hydroxy-9,10-secoandrosta-1,3,5(10)-triene-9,17-dione monooxygenase [Bradyrhizobium elkanii]MCP1968114.1 3-hydroxy-9,10-secoandrosta-1,3,5(10)-triene-9,17-dione monooxygenase [Bradyrhizobium elkanii]MCS3478534.1 3-hydroxy-9,10-secoandrosta-1,3,5(10)-triene-9,17-dione monooxygenase [Bradyrhizobium elkanii]